MQSTGLRARLLLLLKGMAIGAADSVPGVSGGTIALICGIYEELVDSIKSVNPATLPLLWREGPAAFWRRINGTFLLILLAGILFSLLITANTVLYLLEFHFVLVMAFFIGLIIASVWMIQKEVAWDFRAVLFLLLGGAISLLAAFANPMQGSGSLLYLFFCGLVAICAMILPGLSGAFILILLGVYDYVLNALRSFQFDVIIVFATGCAIGLLSFAHVLSWTFHHFRQQTFAFLTGMLAASVVVLWPWKQSAQPGPDGMVEEQGLMQANLLPGQYELLTGQSPQLLGVLLLIVGGFTLIAVIERIAVKSASSQPVSSSSPKKAES